MKKIMLMLLLMATISLSITACSSTKNSSEVTNPVPQSSTQEEKTSSNTSVLESSSSTSESNATSGIAMKQEDVSALLPGFGELEHLTDLNEAPAVYITTDISPKGLMAAYKALEWTPEGKVAVKLSTGEPPASN